MSDPAFPIEPAPFKGDSRTAEAGACFDWLRQAWAFFAANPGVWIGGTVLLTIAYLALHIVPLIGALAANLFLPPVVAGMLGMCRKQAQGQDIGLADFGLGFQGRAVNQLVVLGALFTVATFLVFLLAALVAGGSLVGGAIMGRPAGLGLAFGGFLLGFLLAMLLLVPVSMALWFAPALVYFHDMTAVDALKASFHACMRNWLPLLVHSVIVTVLCFFALLPMALGLLVLVPVLVGTLYASYRDIFPGS